MHSSRESSPPRDRTWSLASPALAGGFFTNCAATADAYRIMFIVGGEFAQSTHTRVTNVQTKGQNITSPPEACPRSPQALPNPKMSLVQLCPLCDGSAQGSSLSGFLHLNASDAAPPTAWLKFIHFVAGSLLHPLCRPRLLHPHLRVGGRWSPAWGSDSSGCAPSCTSSCLSVGQTPGLRQESTRTCCLVHQPPLPIGQLHA